MPREYKQNRGASKARASAPKRQVPGWVWLFTGIVTGLFIAMLFHLAKVQMAQPGQPLANTDDTPASSSADAPNKPRFDFYAVLPKMEVIVPQSESQDPKNNTDSSLAHRHQQHYLLQAGSFRNPADADGRRAELLLEGFDVHIQTARVNDGDVWHRVMIGPYSNINAMHRAQDKLGHLGIKTLPIRLTQQDTP